MTIQLSEKTKETVVEPILINNLTWKEFKVVAQIIQSPGVRVSFLDGVLEIRKMPGKKHETIKKRIAALIEIYLEFLGIDFTPTGSMTLESEGEKVKCEADESYELTSGREYPDLAIEVTVSSGGINKLEAYQRLQISEVWFWEKGELLVYTLAKSGYKQVKQSVLLPKLDLTLFVNCVNLTNHSLALRKFRESLTLPN
jgi:Uma2 family endonuclease